MQPLNDSQNDIIALARVLGRVTVEDLAARFDVTPQTIRKDLNELCDKRLLARIHGGAILSSTEALSLQEIPEQFVVVGAGYIGLELGIAFRKFGANVTIVEALDRILPLYDEQLTDPVHPSAPGDQGAPVGSEE